MKIFIICVFMLYGIVLGCSKNLIEEVKGGALENDKTLTVGSVFDNYKYFGEKSWRESVDDRGRKVVVFSGTVDVGLDKYLNKALYIANNISIKDSIAFIDLIYYYTNYPLSIHARIDLNKKEAESLKQKIDGKRDLAERVSISFAKSIKDNSVLIVDKKIEVFNKRTGEEVKPECNQSSSTTAFLDNLYKGTEPDDQAFRCVLSYDIIPIEEMKEYPSDIKILKEAKNKRAP
jgi:hypothetical protein